jgi:hypothetical protein
MGSGYVHQAEGNAGLAAELRHLQKQLDDLRKHFATNPQTFGVGAVTPAGPQTTPVTLADVVALLQAFGLSQ